jgi:hypothetical protein
MPGQVFALATTSSEARELSGNGLELSANGQGAIGWKVIVADAMHSEMPWSKWLCGFAVIAALTGCSSSPEQAGKTALAQACSPPRDYWQRPHNFVGLSPPRIDVGLDRHGSIFWNGNRVSAAQFESYLALAQTMRPQPDVFLDVETGVSCQALEAVRDEMDRGLRCREDRICAEGVRSIWEGLPTPPGTPPS